jgi:hypothetical protein
VWVEYGSVKGSAPTCSTVADFCWLFTRTNSNGEYAFEFEARPLTNNRVGYVGHVYAFADGYEVNLQWVPLGSDSLAQSFALRPVRILAAGEFASVSVGPTSSLCVDLEDLYAVEHRCEIIQVEARQAGTLVVDLRAAGAVVPVVMWATSGHYGGLIVKSGPSTASIPVLGGTYRIFVGMADGHPTERVDVVTSLH